MQISNTHKALHVSCGYIKCMDSSQCDIGDCYNFITVKKRLGKVSDQINDLDYTSSLDGSSKFCTSTGK